MFTYLTICLINNKKYIGKYEGKDTDNYLGSGSLLKRAIVKYGKENFERIILEKYNTKEECREGEKKWIRLFNAVESKDFYNIALGGEGGNTFAGIQGEARVLLIAKLKKRKHSSPPKNITSAFSILEQKVIKVSIEEFHKNNNLIGVASKGIYVTPFGLFCSALLAVKYSNFKDYGTIINRCTNNEVKVNKSHLFADETLSEKDLGKTFKSLGWSFIKRDKLTLEFLNNNKIIKI